MLRLLAAGSRRATALAAGVLPPAATTTPPLRPLAPPARATPLLPLAAAHPVRFASTCPGGCKYTGPSAQEPMQHARELRILKDEMRAEINVLQATKEKMFLASSTFNHNVYTSMEKLRKDFNKNLILQIICAVVTIVVQLMYILKKVDGHVEDGLLVWRAGECWPEQEVMLLDKGLLNPPVVAVVVEAAVAETTPATTVAAAEGAVEVTPASAVVAEATGEATPASAVAEEGAGETTPTSAVSE